MTGFFWFGFGLALVWLWFGFISALVRFLVRLETTSPFLCRWGTSQKGRAVFRREDRFEMLRRGGLRRRSKNISLGGWKWFPGFFGIGMVGGLAGWRVDVPALRSFGVLRTPQDDSGLKWIGKRGRAEARPYNSRRRTNSWLSLNVRASWGAACCAPTGTRLAACY